jgi:hypothetical protein
MRPEHLDARRSKGCKGVKRAGLLARRRRALLLLTVARPRGILTRFPILPAYEVRQGTRTLLAEKNQGPKGQSPFDCEAQVIIYRKQKEGAVSQNLKSQI